MGAVAMLGFLRLAVFGLIGLTVIYWALRIYFRSTERERLEKEYDQGDVSGPRDEYIERGMQAYAHSLRRRLIWLVYVVPVAVVTALIWILNFE